MTDRNQPPCRSPLSGAGLFLLPLPHDDVVAAPTPVALERPENRSTPGGQGPRSLHRADWEYALDELERIGWILFDDEYGDAAVVSEPSLAEIARSLSALRRVADVRRQ